jgi:alkylation response protein AidB-like acyl-CoA dehydrogenase
MLERELFEPEHRIFRDAVRQFCKAEIVPYHAQWERDGVVPRALWHKAGALGLLCMDVAEEYGGSGQKDFRYNMILGEEMVRVGASGVAFTLQNDVVVPYLTTLCTEEQKRRWLPGCVSGEIITAIAMTEPDTGSDLAGIRTTAERRGDDYLLNGQKTFITSGMLANLVIVVARTNRESRHGGLSLLCVESNRPGYEPPRKLNKVGLHAQDTAELFFSNIKVPASNLLGEEGKGFYYLMQQLPQERLSLACAAIAGAQTCLEMTIKYCHERHAFGQEIGTFQNSRFKLAEMKTEIQIGQVFLDRCVMLLNQQALDAEVAAMAKWWSTELLKRVVDQCVQLHGGYGYMLEYPIAKAFIDSRVQTIYGGTTEIMKEIIGRSMGF